MIRQDLIDDVSLIKKNFLKKFSVLQLLPLHSPVSTVSRIGSLAASKTLERVEENEEKNLSKF